MKHEDYENEKLGDLDLFFQKVKKEGCPCIQKVFNEEWYEKTKCLPYVSPHWPYVIPPHWFPFNWLYEDNKWELVNKGILRIDKATKKHSVLRNKLGETLKGNCDNRFDHAFELNVLCTFSSALVDIDYKPQDGLDSNVDGLIELDGQKILLEATRISHNLRSSQARTGIISPKGEMFPQIWKKIWDKLKDKKGNDFQLALAHGPTILAICLPFIGATQPAVPVAVKSFDEIKDEKKKKEIKRKFKCISAIIISDTDKFIGLKWYLLNDSANHPLQNREIEELTKILGSPSRL